MYGLVMATKPSASSYILASIIIVLACGGGCGGALVWAHHVVEDMPRSEMPREFTSTLESGKYYIFFERKSVIDNQPFNVQSPQGKIANIVCSTKTTGSEIEKSSSSQSYEFHDFAGESVFTLNVTDSGPVTILCNADKSDVPFVIAIGTGISKPLLVGGGLALAGFMFGLFLFYRTYVARKAYSQ